MVIFQGTNILVNNNTISGILDWEFCMSGHPIADVAQFFRYDDYFEHNQIKIFRDEYNKYSSYKLQDDWYELAKLRDLVNLIQLLDKDGYRPNKDKDIINLIKKSLSRIKFV